MPAQIRCSETKRRVKPGEMPFSAAASCGMNNPCSQKTSLRNEQSGSATTAEHFGDAGGRQQQHEQRAPQIGDKIKGAALPALPPMGSKIKVKNVSAEGTDERLIINFGAAIQHF